LPIAKPFPGHTAAHRHPVGIGRQTILENAFESELQNIATAKVIGELSGTLFEIIGNRF
jgi:hypothetical protein